MAKAKPRFNPNEAAAKMFMSTQEEQVAHNTQEEQTAQQTHDTLNTQGVQGTHKTQVASSTQNTPSTQGVHETQSTQRAQKHPRINMAFYGDNLEFVREEAWRNKQSITEYVNSLIEQARRTKGE